MNMAGCDLFLMYGFLAGTMVLHKCLKKLKIDLKKKKTKQQ